MGMLPQEGETASAAANNEWLELYNTSSSPVNLDGWKIIAADGSPDITLSGVIQANGYFLLARSTSTIPAVTADLVYPYKNALSNSGERIFLKDSSGAVVDEIDASGGWPAGDNATKETMQRSGNSWFTAAATPRALNASAVQISSSSSIVYAGNSSLNQQSVSNPEPAVSSLIRSISAYAGEDRAVAAGSLTEFSGIALGLKNEPLENARFLWNFGDGEIKEGRLVRHIFLVPGEYLVGLHVSSGEYASSDYVKIEVVPNKITVAGVLIGEDGFIRLSNQQTADIDIGGWLIQDSLGSRFVVPIGTKIGSRSEMALANSVTGLLKKESSLPVVFYYPNSKEAFRYNGKPAENNISPPADSVSGKTAGDKSGVQARQELAAAGLGENQKPSPAGKISAGSSIFFFAAVILGAAGSLGFMFLKRLF
jgi:hypothetical protein